MKTFINARKMLLVAAAATLPLTLQLYAQESVPFVGPRPPKAGDERIVKSSVHGYLRVYTPETPVFDTEGPIGWNNDNYRVHPESGAPARTGFHRRALALDPGIYVVKLRGYNYDQDVRVSIESGRITEVWLNDSDRPKFTKSAHPALVRDVYGDVIGFRNN